MGSREYDIASEHDACAMCTASAFDHHDLTRDISLRQLCPSN
jgi:hypothetical protein